MKRVILRTHRQREDVNSVALRPIQYLQEYKVVSLFGLKLWDYWKTIDAEEVPMWAWSQHCCVGFTEWKSKWYGWEGVEFMSKNHLSRAKSSRMFSRSIEKGWITANQC